MGNVLDLSLHWLLSESCDINIKQGWDWLVLTVFAGVCRSSLGCICRYGALNPTSRCYKNETATTFSPRFCITVLAHCSCLLLLLPPAFRLDKPRGVTQVFLPSLPSLLHHKCTCDHVL